MYPIYYMAILPKLFDLLSVDVLKFTINIITYYDNVRKKKTIGLWFVSALIAFN